MNSPGGWSKPRKTGRTTTIPETPTLATHNTFQPLEEQTEERADNCTVETSKQSDAQTPRKMRDRKRKVPGDCLSGRMEKGEDSSLGTTAASRPEPFPLSTRSDAQTDDELRKP